MIDLSTQKETATKAAKDVSDSTVEYAGKAKDIGMSSAKSATDSANDYLDKTLELGLTAADAAVEAIKLLMEQAMTFTDRGFEKVSDVQVGQKNVGERVQATVDSVEEKIDVDQLQDQVAKLREQMEHVLISWKDSFRPSSTVTAVVAEEKVPAKKAVTKQAPAKKATVKRTTTKKTAPKKTSTAKKATAKKVPATKATAKK
jgi:hypothetical protein